MKNQPAKKKKAKKKTSPAAFLFVALFLLVAALVLLRFSGIGAAPGSSSFKQMLSSTQLMQNAKLVKQDLKDIAYQMKDNDVVQLEYSSRKLDSDVAVLKEYISTPVWTVAEIVPILGQDVKTAKALVEISEAFSDDLLKSWIDLQKKAPYTEIKTEDGYNDEMIELYLAYFGENLPTVKGMADRLGKLNLRLVDENGKITAAIRQAAPLITFADKHFAAGIKPGVEFLLAHHPSELKTESGFNMEMAAQYFAYLNDNLPEIKSMLEELDTVDLSMVDKDGKIRSFLDLVKPMVEIDEQYYDSLILPGFVLVNDHPLSGIKTDDGYDFEALGLYSDFFHDNRESIDSLLDKLASTDLGMIDKEGKAPALIALGKQLLEIGGSANEELLRPALQLLKEHPFSSIKVENGFNMQIMLAYLDFIEEKESAIEAFMDELNHLDLSSVGGEGKLNQLLGKIKKLQEASVVYREAYYLYKDYIPAVRVLLGNGHDRLYAFPAQNSAEIRATGGFPGDIGTIQVCNNVLMVNPFLSVYISFANYMPRSVKITQQEVRIFTARMYAPRDVDFCIDFERVAQIWTKAYEAQTGQNIDGIISATPVVVQKLLSVCDEPITLSNGMTLDGTTATRVLQRDLYFQYKRAGMDVYSSSDMTDILFSETISKTMEQVAGSLDMGHILDFLKVFKECIDERIIMVWMEDPDEQEIIRQAGWSGALNSDPEDPKLGIFFSSEQSGKMGYFFDMIPDIGEPVVNEDGSRTYDVTLTLNNVITKEEQRIGGTWILGRYYVGSIVGDLTLTAPAGGRITDVSLSIHRGMRNEEYRGLDTHYVQWLIIERQSPIIVRFKVTTAPNVDTPLGIMATPTLTNYRS